MSPVIRDERERRSEFFPSLAPFKMVRYWNCQKYQTKIAFWIFYEELTRSDPAHSADYGPGWVGDDTSVLLNSECHQYSQAEGDGNFKYIYIHLICHSFDLVEFSLFKGLPFKFNASLIYDISKHSTVFPSLIFLTLFLLVDAWLELWSRKWRKDDCSIIQHVPQTRNRPHNLELRRDGDDKLRDVQPSPHLFRWPVHPGDSRWRRAVSWAGDGTSCVVWKSLKYFYL